MTTATGNVRSLLRISASCKPYKRNWLHPQRTQLRHNSTTPPEASKTLPTLSKLLRRELRLIQGNFLAQRKPTVIVYHACLENPPSVGRVLATATSFERIELPLDTAARFLWSCSGTPKKFCPAPRPSPPSLNPRKISEETLWGVAERAT